MLYKCAEFLFLAAPRVTGPPSAPHPPPCAQAKDLALEGPLAVYPVAITSAVVTIPAAAVQVAASEAEESSVAAATRKIKETISEVC